MSTTGISTGITTALGLTLSAFEWARISCPMSGLLAYQNLLSGLRVIESERQERLADGRLWHHVSCSHQGHLPSFNELKLMKRCFVGDERTALQVFPPAVQYVNDHPFVLHLWTCVSEEVVPDFRNPDGGI